VDSKFNEVGVYNEKKTLAYAMRVGTRGKLRVLENGLGRPAARKYSVGKGSDSLRMKNANPFPKREERETR